jgi:hypothetical protein
MFQFPRFPPPGLFCSARGTQAFPWVGFPIRVSPDIALRHPPCALSSLIHVDFWNYALHPVQFLRCQTFCSSDWPLDPGD